MSGVSNTSCKSNMGANSSVSVPFQKGVPTVNVHTLNITKHSVSLRMPEPPYRLIGKPEASLTDPSLGTLMLVKIPKDSTLKNQLGDLLRNSQINEDADRYPLF
jgi:hypothetical protein